MKLLLSLMVLFAIPMALSGADKPNVIYILADDLGYGDLSIYGQKKLKTPNIDRIGTEGLKFTDHYSGNTVCSPSRAVLMTGLHSGHCFVRGNIPNEEIELDPKWTVLPEVFKAAGYATGAYGKWGLGQTNIPGNKDPLTHGFDEFVGWKSQSIAHTYYPSTYVHNGKEVPLEKGKYLHDLLMEKAFDFIKKNAKEKKPFFCYIPTAVPHAAMHAPKHLHEKWRKVYPQFDKKIGKYGAKGEYCPDVKNPIAGYAGMMENLDNQIGAMLEMLKELGIDDNTIVMFTSDNGAHKEGGHDPKFWNSTGPLKGYKRVMHEGGIRTPMLVRWPKHIKAGRTSDHISGFQDILPTVADLVGQKTPEGLDGISFVSELKGETQKKHKYLYFEFTKGKDQKIYSQAVRMGKWKVYRLAKKPLQLYNLEEDLGEENNLAKKYPEVVKEFEKIIKEAHTPLK